MILKGNEDLRVIKTIEAIKSSFESLIYEKDYERITVKYLDQSFQHRTGSFEGFPAQIIQHEIDHCEGILI